MQHLWIIITHASMMCPKTFDEAFQTIRDFAVTNEVSTSIMYFVCILVRSYLR